MTDNARFVLPPGETFLTQNNFKYYDDQRHLYYEAKKHVKKFRTAIDVGANVGFFSSKMVKDFNQVHAFEPMFSEYTKQNVTNENFTVYPLGLSNEKKEYRFNVKPHHIGMSRIDEKGKHTIQCDVLDNYNFTDVDLIKIDVEHHELSVLEGMKTFLQNNAPVIIIETAINRELILDILSEYGYSTVLKDKTDDILVKENIL